MIYPTYLAYRSSKALQLGAKGLQAVGRSRVGRLAGKGLTHLSHASTAAEIGLGGYGAYQGFQNGDIMGGIDSARMVGGSLRGIAVSYLGRGAMTNQMAGLGKRYAKSSNSTFRENVIKEARSLVGATRKMNRRGYRLRDIDLQYSGNHGVDMVYSRGNRWALLEAKGGKQTGAIFRRSNPQGGPGWSSERLQRYINRGNNQDYHGLAHRLLDGIDSRDVRTFGYSHIDNSLWQLGGN
ncbi:MAG: hypothetical protein JEZ07_01840 [Phycisphaerae bacterium]|nr:hypothetical protein [Phycisphaerae bacterium]